MDSLSASRFAHAPPAAVLAPGNCRRPDRANEGKALQELLTPVLVKAFNCAIGMCRERRAIGTDLRLATDKPWLKAHKADGAMPKGVAGGLAFSGITIQIRCEEPPNAMQLKFKQYLQQIGLKHQTRREARYCHCQPLCFGLARPQIRRKPGKERDGMAVVARLRRRNSGLRPGGADLVLTGLVLHSVQGSFPASSSHLSFRSKARVAFRAASSRAWPALPSDIFFKGLDISRGGSARAGQRS